MITTNKEAIPNDPRSPFITSGLRIGTPAITSRGFDEEDSREVAQLIIETLNNSNDQAVLSKVADSVQKLVAKHPVE